MKPTAYKVAVAKNSDVLASILLMGVLLRMSKWQ